MEFRINTSIPISFERKESEIEDLRFTPVRIYLCHTNENLNGSYFSKEVLIKMSETLANIPILGYIAKDNTNESDFTGHEQKLVITENGIDIEYLGKAYGLISESHNARFETKLCEDGVEREYLVCDGYIWNKFKESKQIFDRDVSKSQSMELLPQSIKGSFQDDNLFHFTDATCEGACVLGFGVNPAMKGSTIEKYNVSSFGSQIEELKNEFKEFEKTNIVEVVSVPLTKTEWKCPHCFSFIGEKQLYFDGKSWFHSPCMDDGEIIFPEEDLKMLEFNYKLNNDDESKEDKRVPEIKTKKEIAEMFSLTTNQLYEELSRKLGEKKYESTNWNGEKVEYSKYYMRDFDESFLYAVDRENGYIDVKIPFSKEADDVSFEFDKSSRIKWSPLDWESSTEEIEVENFTLKILDEVKKDFDKVVEEKAELTVKLDKQSDSLLELDSKFNTLNETISEKETQLTAKDVELETLKEFKLQIEKNERQEKVENLFEKYKTRLTKEEVDSFKEKESTFSLFADFEREVKLFVADKVADDNSSSTNSNGNTQFSRMGLTNTTQTPDENRTKSVWEKLEGSK